MATIQLLLEDDQNRRLLADALGEDYDVVEGATSADEFLTAEFDLCIVDAATLRGQRELLARKKSRATPAFLPYLLLFGTQSPGQATEEVWDDVDEVVDTPIERGALENRVSNLLQRRELSLELKRRQEVTEERFRTLFESTPDPIVVVTAEGIVTEVNEAFTRTFGVDRADVLDRPVGEIGLKTTESIERLLLRADETADARGDAEDDGDAASAESGYTLEIETADGETHVTELNVDVVEELGETTERIGIFRDVTGREAYQEQLQRQVEQLEQFASVLSHDLRDPLNTAQAKARLAQRACDSEKLAELLDVLDRMEALVEDVLDLAKQGRVVGETEPVDLDELVEAAWATVDAPETASVRIDSVPSALTADRERLQALLENLFRNAVVHAGPEVAVEVGTLPEERGFYVADDGPGIPEEAREDVFEYGHTTADDGSGLGLSIVDQIAEAHGWTVRATSSETGGARFEIVTR